MTSAQYVAWAEAMEAQGRRDAFGFPFTSGFVAVENPDGTHKRDQRGHQIFETFTEHKARLRTVPVGKNLELFA